MKFSLSLLLAALVLPALPLSAQVLPELNYQGRVAVNGTAFTGTGQFRFALVADNGSVVWSSHATNTTGIAVQNGLYSVRLGDTSLPNMAAVPSALFTEPGLRLRVWFNDGANGLQQLAPDQFVTPVAYAHRASSAASADSIPASAIDGGAIQPSHLTKSLQTGSAAGLASIPAAGGVLNVTFPQAFETPPAVTLAGLTVPAANVTTTGFSYTVPPRDLVVDDGSPPSSNVGRHHDVMLVGGFPAIAYTDETNGDLKYIRATNAQGTAWGAPVTAAVGGTVIVGDYCSMALVAGNPAIAYYDSTNKDLKYVRANDTTGATWGAPVTVAGDGPSDLGKGCKLRYIIQSVSVRRPVIAYHDATAGTVRVKIANDGTGATWGAQQTPDPALSGLTDSSAFNLIPNGTGLEIIYHDPANGMLKVVSSPTIVPAAWGPPSSFASGIAHASALDFFFTPTGSARCYETGWVLYADSTPVISARQTGDLRYSAVSGGNPGMVIQTDSGLLISNAEDAEGLRWGPARPVVGTPASGSNPGAVRLADGSTLAVFYADAGSNGQLRVSSSLAPASAEWQAQLISPLMAAGVAEGSITRDSLAPEFFGENSRSPGASAFAVGSETLASGTSSMASGTGTTASGGTSTAMGYNTTASGFASTATGSSTIASGLHTTAMGENTTASGFAATTMGSNTTASGYYSTAMGFGTTASGYMSTAMGRGTTASGDYSTAMGIASRADTYGEVSLGILPVANTGDAYARVETDVLMEVGNGVSGTPSNALTIFKNGRTGLGDADTAAEVTHLLTLPNSTTATIGQARANAWTTYSDSRIKTEQRPISYGLAELMRLQPRAYTQHSGCVENGTFQCEDATGGSAETIGFIAQEVEQVIPEAVQKPEDPANQLYGMDYQKLVPVLVKAAQELKAENDTLKSGAAALKTELDATNAALRLLQQRLDRLERPARKR